MKSKILLILHLPPPVHGAAMVGSYIKKSSVINENLDIRYINLGTSKSVDDIGKGGFRKIIRFIGLLWQVSYQMMVFRPAKVYVTLTAQGNGFYKDAVVVFLVKMLGGNMIYHFHNKGIKQRQDNLLDHWLYQRVFKNSEVILLSKYLYLDVEKYVPQERVHICPNGISDQLSEDLEKKSRSKREPVCLLFLSNLIESKGVYVLLEACTILKEKGVSFQCVFVGGEGDIRATHLNKMIAEAGLEEEVTYAGRKYNEEKEEIFAKSDIFVHPTSKDCFPLVLLEAMQAELPVISTPEGGIPDVVNDGETGFLVPRKDSEALAEKLEELIKNPQKRKEMGLKGYKKYQREFTLQIFENRFAAILRKITGNR